MSLWLRSRLAFLLGSAALLALVSASSADTPCSPPPKAPEVVVSVAIGIDKGHLTTRWGDKECLRLFTFRNAEDIPALLRLIPRGSRVREVVSLVQTPPELLAALLPDHPEIESLRLAGDRLTDEDLKHLAGLKQLRHLTLGAPRVTAGGLTVLSGLCELRELYVWASKTPVTDDGLKALSGLTKLRDVRLEGTRITDAGLSHLRRLTRLETLNVDKTRVGRLKEWPDLPALSELSLVETEVGDDDLPHLARYPHLRGLDLDRTHLTGKTLDSLAKLQYLTKLSLTHAPVTDDGVARLARASQMESLDLTWTAITDDCLPHLARLKALKYVFLGWTKVTRTRAVEFSKEHPRLVVYAPGGKFRGGKRQISPGEAQEKAGRDRAP